MKSINRIRIHNKLRHTVKGTAERPRLSVYRSLTGIYAQLIDDVSGKTLAASTTHKDKGPLVKQAESAGKQIADLAKELKIKSAVFDRGGYAYKGAVKALCESARTSGLKI